MESNKQLLNKTIKLITYWQEGKLVGSFMSEDQNPHYPIDNKENYLYFTFPMALNYQRNLYKLWESAQNPAIDSLISLLPKKFFSMSEKELRDKLFNYQIALQMNTQPLIWR